MGRKQNSIIQCMSFVLLALAIAACGRFNQNLRRTSPDAIHGFWETKSAQGAAYTAYARDAIAGEPGATLLDTTPADVGAFCPAYGLLDRTGRVAFWVALISAMAEKESDFNPAAKHTEDFSDSQGAVVSRGLLQISRESTKHYGCEFSNDDELHDAHKNLECGVRVLAKLVSRDLWISGRTDDAKKNGYLGGARYWSVLRPGSKLELIRRRTAELELCRL